MPAPTRLSNPAAYVVVVLTIAVTIITHRHAGAYPEFQAYSQTNSGRGVSCGMCHVNPDGPDGTGHGQIGGLKKDELNRLNEARTAFEPGAQVNSPILNAFGNEMVQQLGKKRILELKLNPDQLAPALDQTSDLDDDGVSDAQEFAEGTHPLHKSSGNPWLLFLHNLKTHPFPIIMVVMATLLMLYGLRNLHKALEVSAASNKDDHEVGTSVIEDNPECHEADFGPQTSTIGGRRSQLRPQQYSDKNIRI